MKLEGCILGYNTADGEDAGCPENESEDGTVYWYQMANCLRPQAVFSLYNSKSCSSSSFKESVSQVLTMSLTMSLHPRQDKSLSRTQKSLTYLLSCNAAVYYHVRIRRVYLLPFTV